MRTRWNHGFAQLQPLEFTSYVCLRVLENHVEDCPCFKEARRIVLVVLGHAWVQK